MVDMAILTLILLLSPPGLPADDAAATVFCAGPCADNIPSSHRAPDALTTRSRTHSSADRAQRFTANRHPNLSGLAFDVTLHPVVGEHIRYLTEGRGRYTFAGWYARMGRYESMMTEILKSHSVPPELIYVCMIESGFMPDAVSRAGAVGPWQFMPESGRIYGLRHDDWVDERRDPIKATHAAAKMLKDLNKRFGTWPLALAAYNAGPGAIAGPIKRNGTNDFWRLVELEAIPRGAAWYAARATAAMVIGHNAQLYGFDKVRRDPPWRVSEVVVPGGLDIAVIANTIGLTQSKLAALNPELRRGFTPTYPQGYRLKVPMERAEALQAAVIRLEKRRTRVFQPYTVRFGERLSDIAYKFSVTRSTLAKLNDLKRREPAAGAELVVPRRDARSDRLPQLSVLQDPKLVFDYEDRKLVYFPVRRHLSLIEIAAFFNVSTGSLAMWNGLDPSLPLQRGMVLRIYASKDFDESRAVLVNPDQATEVVAGSPGAQATLRFLRSSKSENRKIKRHRVVKGDTLRKLARRYKVEVSAIRAVNGGKKRIRLKVGQTIKIPISGASRPRGKAAKRRPKIEIRGKRYKVKRGDTLSKIAKRFGTTAAAIRKKNRLSTKKHIRAGQELVMP